MKKLFGLLFLTFTVTACMSGSPATPTTPTPTGAAPSVQLSGVWTGTEADSSTLSASGALMGQAGMGNPTWSLSQSGANVTGTMSYSGMMSGAGTLTGTVSGQDMTFTMTMPMGIGMSGACIAVANGTAHIDGTTMVMTGTYAGSNSCTGPFSNGQMTMTRR